MATLSQRMTALEAAIATIADAVASTPKPAGKGKSKSRANTFVRDVIRSTGHKCDACGKTFKTAARAEYDNHWHKAS